MRNNRQQHSREEPILWYYIYPNLQILSTTSKEFLNRSPLFVYKINRVFESHRNCSQQHTLDDSDVELEGMLPEDTTDTEDDGVAQHAPLVTSTRSSSPNSDFASGLSFPAIHDSESSDDDIDLQTRKQVPMNISFPKEQFLINLKTPAISGNSNVSF